VRQPVERRRGQEGFPEQFRPLRPVPGTRQDDRRPLLPLVDDAVEILRPGRPERLQAEVVEHQQVGAQRRKKNRTCAPHAPCGSILGTDRAGLPSLRDAPPVPADPGLLPPVPGQEGPSGPATTPSKSKPPSQCLRRYSPRSPRRPHVTRRRRGMPSRWITAALVTALLVCGCRPVFAAGDIPQVSISGLETGSHTIPYVIEVLSDDAKRIGLTREIIATKVELRIRSVGLKPVKAIDVRNLYYYLYVRVTVAGDMHSLNVEFSRVVSFKNMVGQTYLKYFGSTWNKRSLGMHAADAAYVLSVLEQPLDEFLNDYLKANPK